MRTALRLRCPDPWLAVAEIALLGRSLGWRGWIVATGAGVLAALALGIPTDLIETPLFTRMIAARSQDYVLWVLSAAVVGVIAASYWLAPVLRFRDPRTLSGGVLAYFAIGCPICNKLVLVVLGTSGALSFFAPLQIYLGIAALVGLIWALRLRAGVVARGCEMPRRRDAVPAS